MMQGGVSLYEIIGAPGGPKLSYDAVRRAAQRAIEEEVGWLSWGPIVGLDSHGGDRRNLLLTQKGLEYITSTHFRSAQILFSRSMGFEIKPRRTR